MNIGILGTGVVGQTLAAALAEKGHAVTIGTRDPAETMARETAKPPARVAYRDWQRANPSVQLATFADAARSADVVINATSGASAMSALESAGADALGDRILIDASNPLDFSKGMPPTLTVCNTDSLGEQIQKAFPRVRLVKTLNTVTANLMVNPGAVNEGDHTLFVCGNDAFGAGAFSSCKTGSLGRAGSLLAAVASERSTGPVSQLAPTSKPAPKSRTLITIEPTSSESAAIRFSENS